MWVLAHRTVFDSPRLIEGRLVDEEVILRHVVDGTDITLEPRVMRNPTRDNVARIHAELLKLIDVPVPSYTMDRVMYVGFPQSGKSLVQFILMWTSCFVYEKGTCHLLMNRIDSLLQNMSRDYPDLCKKIYDICERLDIPDYENYLFDYIPFPTYAARESEADSIHTVYVAMANVTQLTKMYEVARVNRQTIVFDEADVFIQKEDKPVMNLISKIVDEAERRYECTATPFSNFNEAGQVYDKVYKIPAKPQYRGYNSPKIRRKVFDNMNNKRVIREILPEICTRDTGEYPNITLINVDTHVTAQENLASKIEAKYPGQFRILVMNSKSTTYERPLSETFDKLVNEDDPRPLLVIAGMMASRAITFRTSKENPKQGILTNMVYMPSKKATQTTLMQAQRVYGNYDESCPDIHLYCPRAVHEVIRSSFLNNSVITDSVVPDRESRACITSAPVIDTKRKFSNSDDTSFEKLCNTEFDTRAKLHEFLGSGRYNVNTYVTTSVGDPRDMRFHVASSSKQDVRRALLAGLGTLVGVHVAWGEQRYAELSSIKHRLGHPQYTVAKYTCGDGVWADGMVACVKWARGYEDVRNWIDPETVYVFRTTTGKWKFWIPGQMEMYKKIVHV